MRATTASIWVAAVALASLVGCSSTGQNAAEPPPSSASATSSDLTASSHANQVNFINKTGTTLAFTWTPGSYSITPDQASTWSGVSNCSAPAGVTCLVTVQAGRKASTTPAQWFASQAPAAMATWSGSGEPSDLNFAVGGTFAIGGNTYTTALGQGSFWEGGTFNNWWIGGQKWTVNSSTSAVITPDGKYQISEGGGLDHRNEFIVSAKS
ncbi:MAG: hypothetical protein WCI74_17345 [Actinomycetes bacterium]